MVIRPVRAGRGLSGKAIIVYVLRVTQLEKNYEGPSRCEEDETVQNESSISTGGRSA